MLRYEYVHFVQTVFSREKVAPTRRTETSHWFQHVGGRLPHVCLRGGAVRRPRGGGLHQQDRAHAVRRAHGQAPRQGAAHRRQGDGRDHQVRGACLAAER